MKSVPPIILADGCLDEILGIRPGCYDMILSTDTVDPRLLSVAFIISDGLFQIRTTLLHLPNLRKLSNMQSFLNQSLGEHPLLTSKINPLGIKKLHVMSAI